MKKALAMLAALCVLMSWADTNDDAVASRIDDFLRQHVGMTFGDVTNGRVRDQISFTEARPQLKKIPYFDSDECEFTDNRLTNIRFFFQCEQKYSFLSCAHRAETEFARIVDSWGLADRFKDNCYMSATNAEWSSCCNLNSSQPLRIGKWVGRGHGNYTFGFYVWAEGLDSRLRDEANARMSMSGEPLPEDYLARKEQIVMAREKEKKAAAENKAQQLKERQEREAENARLREESAAKLAERKLKEARNKARREEIESRLKEFPDHEMVVSNAMDRARAAIKTKYNCDLGPVWDATDGKSYLLLLLGRDNGLGIGGKGRLAKYSPDGRLLKVGTFDDFPEWQEYRVLRQQFEEVIYKERGFDKAEYDALIKEKSMMPITLSRARSVPLGGMTMKELRAKREAEKSEREKRSAEEAAMTAKLHAMREELRADREALEAARQLRKD